MKRALAGVLMLVATVAGAQEATEEGSGATLRGLDKLTGRVTDLDVASGSSVSFGRIEIALQECRYPQGDKVGDAFAFLTIREAGKPDPAFRGWMIASSPALNPMDHQRYDVWVLRCTTS
ncbi:DUF2155 domain-containing protein [Salipiger mangrovisoli]|uniref:DUF2155 domain-containing protein n=1 Tax=Salipiger mangrovisoli TaxID=2865933 RepID=A0ABR9X756_9RHOB|nr:DUF2155 domain-containing protein [Salipiger mangrovisoli]MBE9639409.1 DUF2155 domain-containing protein [Salipiger mangrovisoli]